MYPIGIVAPDDAAAGLRDRLASELGARGSVAVVTAGTPAGDPADGAPTRYRLGDDGSWTAEGTGLSLREALASLAPDHDYALVSGYPDAALPAVVVGDEDYDGEPLVSAASAAAVDVDGVLAALDEVEPFETLESLVARIKRSPEAERAGAIATFTGRVRAKDAPDDTPTTRLEFEKYAGVAEDRMADLSDELAERDGVVDVVMHHRTGVIEYGEDIVFVVVLAGHREEAFRTVEDGINRLKAEIPIFKKEVTVDESFWVHERP